MLPNELTTDAACNPAKIQRNDFKEISRKVQESTTYYNEKGLGN